MGNPLSDTTRAPASCVLQEGLEGPERCLCHGSFQDIARCPSTVPPKNLPWQATPFCSGDCHRRLYPSHRGVCGFWPRPLLPSQVALRMGLEAHMVRGLSGGALQGAVLRQMQAVQRSYQAAAVAAAAATGVVGE